jgi:hypothetical protein
MAVTAGGTPYVESSDLVANYPAVSLALAEHIDALPQTILQVVSTFKADTFTSSSTSLVDVTGLTATITPTSATSKVLVTVSLSLTTAGAGSASRAAILRNSTIVGGGTPAGNRGSITFFARLLSGGDGIGARSFTFLDDPATTTATVYKVQAATEDTLGIGYAYNSDNDVVQGGRIGASITLMEISA